MKKIIFTIALIVFSLNTNAQDDDVIKYFKNIPILSAEPEILNRDSFPCVANRIERDYNIKKPTKFPENRSYTTYNTYNDTKQGLYYTGFATSEVTGKETINPYFQINKKFYTNDTIKEKNIWCEFGFNVGKQYYYDESGELIQVIDHDEGYDFTLEDVMGFCERNRFYFNNFHKYKNLYSLKKETDENNNPVWHIRYYASTEPAEVLLDGKTGKIIATNKFLSEYFRNIPEISAEPEVLNRDLFPGVCSKAKQDSIKNIYKQWELAIKNATKAEREKMYTSEKNPYHNRYYYSRENQYTEKDKNGMIQKKYKGFCEYYNSGVSGQDFRNPYIYEYRTYYPNDALRSKALYSTFGFRIGKEYRYNEKGNLTETIDHNKGYVVTAEDIINFCMKRGVNLDKIKDDDNSYDRKGCNVEIRKFKDKEGRLLWAIEYYYDNVNSTHYYIQIDGKTGWIVKESEENIFYIE